MLDRMKAPTAAPDAEPKEQVHETTDLFNAVVVLYPRLGSFGRNGCRRLPYRSSNWGVSLPLIHRNTYLWTAARPEDSGYGCWP